MKSLIIILASFIFILTAVSSGCKKNKDSLTANAGTGRAIVLPRDSVTLTGTGVSIGGSIASYHWVKKSGPTQGMIVSPNSASTLVIGLVVGTYEFELTVTDSNGIIASDRILITVYTNDPCFGCWDY